MNRLRLSKAKATVARALGWCIDDSRLVDFINEAQQRLLNRPTRSVGCDTVYCFNATSSCLTLPRQIRTVERWSLDHTPGAVRPEWFDFAFNGWGRWDEAHPSDHAVLKDTGRACCFNDPTKGAEHFIRVTTDLTEATGTYLWLYGWDESGNYIRSFVDGEWVDGERIDLSAAPVVTTHKFTSLTQAWKDETKGMVRLYEWDGAAVVQALAYYEPSETDPIYRRVLIPGLTAAAASETQVVTVFARLQHIPVSVDNDTLIIGNLPALKLMCMAIKAEEEGRQQDAAALEGKAIHELEGELAAYMGDGVGVLINVEPDFGAGQVRSVI